MIKAETQEKILHFGFLFCVLTPRKTTIPGVCSPVEAGEHTRRLEYERQYSRSDLYCGDSSLRSE